MKNFDGYLKLKLGNDYVLLAGGSHKALSDFSMNGHSHEYLPLSGGALSNGAYISWKDSAVSSLITDSTYMGICMGILLSCGSLRISADTDASISTENVIITAGYRMADATAANGLSIGKNSLKWKGTDISLDGHTHSVTGTFWGNSWSNGGSTTGDIIFPGDTHGIYFRNDSIPCGILKIAEKGPALLGEGNFNYWITDSKENTNTYLLLHTGNYTTYVNAKHDHPYLPLAGNTTSTPMTGPIHFSNSNNRAPWIYANNSELDICWNYANREGAGLAVYSKDAPSTADKGVFYLWADNGTTRIHLVGKPDETLTWNNKSIVLSPTLDNYLALSGGILTGTTMSGSTMTGGNILWNSDGHGLYVKATGGICGIDKRQGYGPSLVGEGNYDFYICKSPTDTTHYVLLHSNNWTTYINQSTLRFLKNTTDLFTGELRFNNTSCYIVNSSNSLYIANNNSSGRVVLESTLAAPYYRQNGTDYTIYHSGNFTPGNYLPLSGGTMTGGNINWTTDSHGIYFYNNCGIEKWSGYGPSLVAETGYEFAISSKANRANRVIIIHTGGGLTINGNLTAVNFYTTSDARKKQNIHKISDNIKQFEWKESGETSYGFVAQDLEVKHPELVNDDGNMKTVNYNAALSLVVAKLENRVKELEAKLGLETPPLYLTRAKIVKLTPSFAIMEERNHSLSERKEVAA